MNNIPLEKEINNHPEEDDLLPDKDLADQIKEIVPDIDESAKQELVSVFLQRTVHHSGPIPSPETIKRYNEVIPNGAERIMTMAEVQSNHRRGMEKKELNIQYVGLFLAFCIAMSVIIPSIILIYQGRSISGISTLLLALSSLVGVFVYGRKLKFEELKLKMQKENTTEK